MAEDQKNTQWEYLVGGPGKIEGLEVESNNPESIQSHKDQEIIENARKVFANKTLYFSRRQCGIHLEKLIDGYDERITRETTIRVRYHVTRREFLAFRDLYLLALRTVRPDPSVWLAEDFEKMVEFLSKVIKINLLG